MSQKHSNLSYIPELDGIRGIAILLVMIYHIGNPLFKGGFIGVDIFFVLSGFLITSLLIKEYDHSSKISLRNFYIRRVLRLAPALIIMLIIIAVSSILLYNKDQASQDIKSILITLFYSANWVRAFNLHDMGILGHTWSLSIEEQFYILWPCLVILLLKLIQSRKQMIIIVTILALSSWLLRIILTASSYPSSRMYNGLDTRADALLTGCILGLILSSNLFDFKNKSIMNCVKYTAISSLFLYLLIFFNIGWSNHHVFYWLGFLVQIFTAFLILHVFISEKSFIKKLLSNKLLIWIGSISYGLYLWHDPVYETIRKFGYSKWNIATYGVLLTFLITSLSFYIAEKPILELKSKFTSEPGNKGSDLKTEKATASLTIEK